MSAPPGAKLAARWIDATLWSEASRGSLPLGAISVELPVLMLDPSSMGVWPIWVLCCAPLAALSERMESKETFLAWSRQALGSVFLEVKTIDVESIEHAKKEGSGRRLPGMPMGAHMGFMSLGRNNADFMKAACGEAVELDRMRGTDAMLCARLKSKELRPQELAATLDCLFDAARSSWGLTSFALGGGGNLGGQRVEHPEFLRRWPESCMAWAGSELAREQAAEMEKSTRQARGDGAGTSRL